jgi:BlaI family transcriptional regulator, penicillinase repressor
MEPAVKKRLPPLADLSPAQREIMEIVWERGSITARELRLLLSQRRSWSRNTVRTFLERMEQKGWLTHRAEGRTFLYSAAHPRPATIGQTVVNVVERVCGGSPEVLLSALLDYRGLTPGELARIRSMLENAKAKKSSRGGE